MIPKLYNYATYLNFKLLKVRECFSSPGEDEHQAKAVPEEWRLLRYKTPVCTSQETRYFSTTESNQLMLCKI
jgi:hypothetical protein